MKDITTIQISKDTLANLNRKKLNHEAKIGKRISMDKYIQELVR